MNGFWGMAVPWPLIAFEAEGAGAGAGGGDQQQAAAGDQKPGDQQQAAAGDQKPGDQQQAAAGDQQQADDPFAWMGDGITEDDRRYLEAKGFKGPGDLYKSLRGAEKVLRGDKIPAPPDDPAKVGEWIKDNGLGAKLGIPEAADGYDVSPPEVDDALKPYVHFSDERAKGYATKAHELGLTKAQFEGMRTFMMEDQTALAKGFVDAAAADETTMNAELDKAWGDQKDDRVRLALETAADYGLGEAQVESLRLGKVAGSAALTRILADLGLSKADDTLKGGGRGEGRGGKLTPEEAGRERQEFQAKHGAALTNRDHPEHHQRTRELRDLMAAEGIGSHVKK